MAFSNDTSRIGPVFAYVFCQLQLLNWISRYIARRDSEDYRELMWLKRIRREKELEQNLGEVTVHAGFRCDGCDVEPIVGSRFQGWAIDIDLLLHTVFHEATSV